MSPEVVTEQAVADSQARFDARHPLGRPRLPKRGPGGSQIGPINANQQVYRPRLEGQILTFSAYLDGKAPAQRFDVLCGDGGIVITPGVARWNQIPRPQATSITVVDGYDPATMTVPVQFEAVSDDYQDTLRTGAGKNASAQAGVEGPITLLEAMAGRGPRAPHAGRGVPPLVVVSSTQSGKQVPIVPPNQQMIDWVITGIEYDGTSGTGVVRNIDGYRTRQVATVTLGQYISGPFDTSNNSTARRARQRQGDAGKFRTVEMRKGEDYFHLAIRSDNGKDHADAAWLIERANKGTRGAPHGSIHGKRATKAVKVKVPLAVYQGVAP